MHTRLDAAVGAAYTKCIIEVIIWFPSERITWRSGKEAEERAIVVVCGEKGDHEVVQSWGGIVLFENKVVQVSHRVILLEWVDRAVLLLK